MKPKNILPKTRVFSLKGVSAYTVFDCFFVLFYAIFTILDTFLFFPNDVFEKNCSF